MNPRAQHALGRYTSVLALLLALAPLSAHAEGFFFTHTRLEKNASGQRRWQSSTGLSYTENVLRNVVRAKNKSGTSEFHGGWRGALSAVERAWEIARAGSSDPRVSVEDSGDGVKTYVVDLGKQIGTVAKDGKSAPLPASHVRLMVARGRYLMSAGPSRGARATGAQWAAPTLAPVQHPPRALETSEIVQELTDAGAQPAIATRAADHVRLGLPSSATYANTKDRLRVRNGYVVSMNADTKILRWSSWVTTKADIDHDGPRAENWRQDASLGRQFPQATSDDYRGAGLEFHRGHMVRSRERSADLRENGKTFVYSNALPQARHNNIGAWNGLEEWVVAHADAGYRVYNVAGPVFAGPVKVLGDGVAVPSSLFKVVALLAPGETAITPKTRVIGVMIPNHNELPMTANWADYRVSVADIERATGLRFFSHLPEPVANALRNQIDVEKVPYVMPPHVKDELDRAAARANARKTPAQGTAATPGS